MMRLPMKGYRIIFGFFYGWAVRYAMITSCSPCYRYAICARDVYCGARRSAVLHLINNIRGLAATRMRPFKR